MFLPIWIAADQPVHLAGVGVLSGGSLMKTRTVHAIQFHLQGMTERSVIIWPGNITEKTCARLINSRRTWMTAGRGDAVLVDHEGKTERQFVDSVELYRVFPAEHNGTAVESAWAWLDEAEVERARR